MPFLHRGVHVGFEEPVGAAAILLCPVQRKIRFLQQRIGLVAVVWCNGNADAGAGEHLVAMDLVRFVELVDDRRRQRRRIDRLCSGLDHREFIDAQPCHDVRGTDAGTQPFGHALQQGVAGRMAKGIVDGLETVQVEAEHRDRPPAAEMAFDLFPKSRSVEQAGQGVVMRHIGHPRLRPAALGDVLVGGDEAAA